MATMKRTGFGQVEPNHLSAQRTAQIYAQLPAADEIDILENGQFVKYDYANGKVDFDGAGEWMMVFNEVKLYDEWRESYKDFAMKKENYTPGGDITHDGLGPFKGQMVPRVIKTNEGDIYTTNCVGAGNTDGKIEYAGIELEVGDIVGPTEASKGFLVKDGDEGIQFQVVKVYTMADGQPAVKLMRI
jgi:hypothetical protein